MPDTYENEYIDLPDDPEIAFAVLHRRLRDIVTGLFDENEQHADWGASHDHVNKLVAFDQVHDLGILGDTKSVPSTNNEFYGFYHDFNSKAEMYALKVLVEDARRQKEIGRSIVVLEEAAKQAIHHLIAKIRDQLNEIALPEDKRDALFRKLHSFAEEVDRNRTRTEAMRAFATDWGRTAKEVGEDFRPLQDRIDKVFDWIDKGKTWAESLPPWKDRKQIEEPLDRLPAPKNGFGGSGDLDDDIPF